MTGGKKEINFLAAQKTMSRAGQTTSFEFILALATIVVAAAMVGWFLFASNKCDTMQDEVTALKTTLSGEIAKKENNDEAFNHYRHSTRPDGTEIFTVKNGKVIYEWDSVRKVAEDTAARLEAARSTDATIKDALDLTSACFETVVNYVESCGCSVDRFEYRAPNVVVTVSGPKAVVDECYRRLTDSADKAGTAARLFVRPVSKTDGKAVPGDSYAAIFTMALCSDEVYRDRKEDEQWS